MISFIMETGKCVLFERFIKECFHLFTVSLWLLKRLSLRIIISGNVALIIIIIPYYSDIQLNLYTADALHSGHYKHKDFGSLIEVSAL